MLCDWTSCIQAICVFTSVASLAFVAPARAEVISPTPTLPVLGLPYIPTSGVGCFPAVNACVVGGAITLTAPVAESFNAAGQDLLSDAILTAQLVTPSNTSLGPITLTGTLEQEVLGRTTSTELGTFNTQLVGLSLSGPVLGHTLTLALDTSNDSTGQTTIASLGDAGFSISSFFDVFVELSFDSTPPLNTGRGPLAFTLTNPIPEPTDLALFGTPLLALAAMRIAPRGVTAKAA